jgi:cytidylate kinase
VVFPHAELKIFLDASPETRALRRFQELQEKFPDKKNELNQEEILKQLIERDHIDSSREHSPLLQPKDAVLFDTTNLSIDGVIEKITKLHYERTHT